MSGPRVLLVSHRLRRNGFGGQPGYVSFIEAEDVLAETAGPERVMLSLGPTDPRLRIRRAAGRSWRQATRSRRPLPTALSSELIRRRLDPIGPDPGCSERYDLAVMVAMTIWDLPLLEGLLGVRRHADQVAVWFPEVWPSELDDPQLSHEPFDLADHIFVGVADSAPLLERLLGRPVHYLPMAVDAARFAAPDAAEPRPIDVLGIGRRHRGLHQALLDWSRKASKLYVYDTISRGRVPDHRSHRENLADTYRRANVAITNHAKVDQPEVTGHRRELPGRLWEGLASGVVMAGYGPDPGLQCQWPGRPVVVELPDDPHQAVELIDDLHRSPLDDVRAANVALALRRNDWGHRWQTVFHTAGLREPAGLRTRLDHLDHLAASLDAHPLTGSLPADPARLAG